MAQFPHDSSTSANAPLTELVARAQRQEAEAFTELYQRYSRPLFAYFKKLIPDEDVAGDLLQETFIRAWEALPQLRNGALFERWLYQIATNILNEATVLHLRILEEPLTAHNLHTIISALTELSTKYWLIAKRRFADLIEYTQTHNDRFAEEANVVVAKITYNSPMNMDWKVDLSAPSVAEALVTTIDGITQIRKRLEQVELENRAKAQEIKHAEQQTDHEQQMAILEREQRRLEIEQRRLELLERQLEIQKKGIEYALEIAGKVVDTLHPGADPATRAMEIQALLPNLVQLQNGKGLELALPAHKIGG